MIDNDVYRFPELWNGKDQHTKHYLERIFDTTCILENVLNIEQFTKYHSPKKTAELEALNG